MKFKKKLFPLIKITSKKKELQLNKQKTTFKHLFGNEL